MSDAGYAPLGLAMVRVKGLSGISTCRNGTGISRNLIYTGVTRGKQLIVILAQPKALARAVRTQKLSGCLTHLPARLAEDIPEFPAERIGCLADPAQSDEPEGPTGHDRGVRHA